MRFIAYNSVKLLNFLKSNGILPVKFFSVKLLIGYNIYIYLVKSRKKEDK